MNICQFMDISTASQRPSQLLDPDQKDKEWIEKMVKSIYDNFNTNYPNSFYNGRTRYREIISYIQAMQDPAKYYDLKDQKKTHNKDLTERGYDPRIINVISKYFRGIYGRILDYNLQITMNPIDPLAIDHIEESRQKMLSLMELKKLVGDEGIALVQQISQQMGVEIPEDMDDMEIKLNSTIPMQFASDMEKAIEWCNFSDRFDRKNQEASKELIAVNRGAFKTKLNANGYPESEPISSSRLLVGYHETEDGRDMSEIGEFRTITISELARENKEEDQLDEAALADIEKRYQGKFNNSILYNQFGGYRGTFLQSENFFKYRINVLDIYFFTWDGESRVEYVTKDGNKRAFKKPLNYYSKTEDKFKSNFKNGKITRTSNQVIYRASWVVGSDYIYNYGFYRACDISEYLPYKLELPIILQEPLLFEGNSTSIIEEMIPIADKCNQFWKLMENCINNFRPKGFRLDIDGFIKAAENYKSQIGKSAQELIKMAIKENIILTSSLGRGNGATDIPYEEIQGGLGTAFSEAFQGLMDCLSLLESISGFGGASTGTPSPYQTKGTSEIAAQSTEYTIRHLFEAKKDLYQRVMRQRAILMEYSRREGLLKGLSYRLDGTSKVVELPKNVPSYVCSLIVEDGPTQDEIMQFKQDLAEARSVPLSEGGITAADKMLIEGCRNLKEGRMLLCVLVKKNMKKAQDQQMAIQQQNAQGNQQTAAMAAQLQQQALERQIQLEASKNASMEADKRETLALQFQFDIQKIQLEGLINSDLAQAQQFADQVLMNTKVLADKARISAKGPELGKRK